MPGEDLGCIGERAEAMEQALVQLVGVTARKIGATATAEEQRVPGEEPITDEQALTARRVPGRMEEGDRNLADAHDVAGVMSGKRTCGDAR